MTNILSKLTKQQTIDLLDTIAQDKKPNLTRRQFYNSLSILKTSGLITCRKPYKLTMFGKIIYNMVIKINQVAKYADKMRIIDTLQDMELDTETRQKLIDALIDDIEVKNML